MNRFLRAGALAGLAGGLAMAVFLRLVGEGPIGRAVALEAAGRPGGAAHDELFSRAAQQVGGMAGAALYGVLLGVILAVVLAATRHRLAGRDDWRRALTLAAAGFVTVSLVPFLKYPANPPAVGDPDTIGQRTALYLLMLLWSVVATLAAWRAARWLRGRGRPEHVALPAGAATHFVLVAAGLALLPANPDPLTAPATLVWEFRMAALGGAALYWAVAGSLLGWLLLRDGHPGGVPDRDAPAQV